MNEITTDNITNHISGIIRVPDVKDILHIIVVPGGGLQADGSPHIFVQARLEYAASLFKKISSNMNEIDKTTTALKYDENNENAMHEKKEIKSPLIALLSSGTTYKPHLRDTNGFIITEAEASALYLMQYHPSIPISAMMEENISLDTIGNAFFLRALHTDYLSFSTSSNIHLHVITNSFHLPRTKAIFEFVFGLPPLSTSSTSNYSPVFSYILTFIEVSNDGLDQGVLSARIEKEQESTIAFHENMSRNSIDSLDKLRNWMYNEHMAYSSKRLLKKLSIPVGKIVHKEEGEEDLQSNKNNLLNSY